MDRSQLSIDYILDLYKRNGYILKDRVYELNVFGIRSKGGSTNTFNDFLCALRRNHGLTWECMIAPATTDPGAYWLEHPMNVEGTAIVQVGQYIDAHKVGMHKGEYRALVQHKPITVWRDKDKDCDFDFNHIATGMYGINIHRSNANAVLGIVDKWSAGCQVFASPIEFAEFLALVDAHIEKGYGDIFTYTLFEEN